MTMTARRSLLIAAVAALPLAAHAQMQPTSAAKNRALFQVSDNDPARWNLVLSNIGNLREGLGGEAVEIVLVSYGPGINMFKGDSPVKARIAEAMKQGVKMEVCQNTMTAFKLTPADMVPEVTYIPSGVVEVMKKQQQGWAYIRS